MACLHSAAWWRDHWRRTGLVELELADDMPDGWRAWLEWQRIISPENVTEIGAIEADAERYITYARTIARRLDDAKLEEPITTIPSQYQNQPLLRD